MKARSLTSEACLKLPNLRMEGVSGIAGVAVKCVNISKNTNGEGSLLEHS